MEVPESIIRGILIRIGMSPRLQGFQYFQRAVVLSFDDPIPGKNMMSKVYPEIAEEMYTTASRVERCMRHAVRLAWESGKVQRDQSFAPMIRHRMSNSQMLAFLVELLRSQAMAQAFFA